jgi:hypothetical protein
LAKAHVYNHKINRKVISKFNLWDFTQKSPNRANNIKWLHLKGYWLKCECVIPNAVMFPKLADNTYQLVNDPVNGVHNEKCDLFTEVSGKRTAKTGIPVVAPKPPTSFTPVKLGLTKDNTKLDSTITSRASKRVQVRKQDSIHSMLAYALTAAKFDIIQHQKEYNLKVLFPGPIFQLPVCKNILKGGDINIGDLTFFDPESENVDWKSKTISKSAFYPTNIPPQAFIIMLVDDAKYDRKTQCLIVRKNEQETEYNCSRVSHHYERTLGPRLIYIINALIDNAWQTVTIYTHPIVSKDIPVLIDSGYEREFALIFLTYREPDLKLLKYYHSKIMNGRQILPDFKLTSYIKNNYWAEIIEVMGMENDMEYVQRKLDIVKEIESAYQLPVREVSSKTLQEGCEAAVQAVKKGNKID